MKLRAKYETGCVLLHGREVNVENYILNVDDNFAKELLAGGDYIVEVKNHKSLYKAKRALFIRGSGLGDVMLCVPIVRYIKKNINKDLKIDWLCGAGNFARVLKGIKWIDNVYTHKTLPNDVSNRYQNIMNIDKAEFGDGQSFIAHRIDVFAHRIPELRNINIKDKTLEYFITDEEKNRKLIESPYIVMICTATCSNRTLSAKMNQEICSKLLDRGIKVVLADHHCDIKFDSRAMNKMGCSISELGSLIYNANAVLSPDTGVVHLAAALKKPTLVYWGAINYKLRITDKSTYEIHYPVECYPCDVYICHRGSPECIRKLKVSDIVKNVCRLVDHKK